MISKKLKISTGEQIQIDRMNVAALGYFLSAIEEILSGTDWAAFENNGKGQWPKMVGKLLSWIGARIESIDGCICLGSGIKPGDDWSLFDRLRALIVILEVNDFIGPFQVLLPQSAAVALKTVVDRVTESCGGGDPEK